MSGFSPSKPFGVRGAALASSLAVTAPASTPEGSTFTVHVTGSADEPELAWTAFVHVDVTATPPSGGPVHATRVVRVT
jgi:hypothetical protein